jgi:hypothetical protein
LTPFPYALQDDARAVIINSSHHGHYPDEDAAKPFWKLVTDLLRRLGQKCRRDSRATIYPWGSPSSGYLIANQRSSGSPTPTNRRPITVCRPKRRRPCSDELKTPDKMTGNDRALRPVCATRIKPTLSSLEIVVPNRLDRSWMCLSIRGPAPATASSGAPFWTRGAFHRCRNRRGRGGLR